MPRDLSRKIMATFRASVPAAAVAGKKRDALIGTSVFYGRAYRRAGETRRYAPERHRSFLRARSHGVVNRPVSAVEWTTNGPTKRSFLVYSTSLTIETRSHRASLWYHVLT